ncbi:Myb-like DNA-binding domain containing protein [Tritrichomonas foetus]|uniref:Myb-like DNA-binding domain containing protein n=1 Tax=Tritrichomonas foetus TaxID=1144522 RepID=A0A1J4KNE3_9EUKA|nr:Myb-like DNA-binding domain containing protein [Tritrichomonas foetus]|eukprot:OHT12424.1 Myb-like DNA-binding domain containing protein [Tritrichomonas foetus]
MMKQKRHIKFSAQEDDLLRKLVIQEGAHRWNKIALKMEGRTAKQCRDRFQNYLNPALSNDPWTVEEDQLLFQKINEFGKKWKLISKYFPRRSHNNVKNRYNSRKYIKSNSFHFEEASDKKSEDDEDIVNSSPSDAFEQIFPEEDLYKIFDDNQLWDASIFNTSYIFEGI